MIKLIVINETISELSHYLDFLQSKKKEKHNNLLKVRENVPSNSIPSDDTTAAKFIALSTAG